MKYFTKTNMKKLKGMSKRYTPGELYHKVREKVTSPYRNYHDVRDRYLPGPKELAAQRAYQNSFPNRPEISIVVPTYETKEIYLIQMIDSCIAQTYPKWQLCIADGSNSDAVESVIAQNYSEEERICYRRLSQNGGISANTNEGLKMAEGEYVAFLDHDDILVPSALYEMVKAINATNADMFYSDEDKVTADMSYYLDPHIKLDFNAELLLGNNYICHFLLVSKEVLARVGGLDSRYDGAQDFDFVLRTSECARKICHVPKVLYHWRVHENSTAGNTDSKQYAYEAGRRALEDALKRRGYKGTVTMSNDPGFYRIYYDVPKGISLQILSWGKSSGKYGKIKQQLQRELDELGISVNWSEETEDTDPGLLRHGQVLHTADAEYQLFLNRGLLRIRPGSLRILLGSCARNGISGVGVRSLCGGKVQQCGYWEKNGRLIPRFQNLPKDFKGYFQRAYLPVEVAAISPDFAVMKTQETDHGSRIVVESSIEVVLR